jgi:hypothetical protein
VVFESRDEAARARIANLIFCPVDPARPPRALPRVPALCAFHNNTYALLPRANHDTSPAPLRQFPMPFQDVLSQLWQYAVAGDGATEQANNVRPTILTLTRERAWPCPATRELYSHTLPTY